MRAPGHSVPLIHLLISALYMFQTVDFLHLSAHLFTFFVANVTVVHNRHDSAAVPLDEM